MSTEHFQGAAHAVAVFMRMAQAEIDRGEKRGARVIYRDVTAKVRLSRLDCVRIKVRSMLDAKLKLVKRSEGVA